MRSRRAAARSAAPKSAGFGSYRARSYRRASSLAAARRDSSGLPSSPSRKAIARWLRTRASMPRRNSARCSKARIRSAELETAAGSTGHRPGRKPCLCAAVVRTFLEQAAGRESPAAEQPPPRPQASRLRYRCRGEGGNRPPPGKVTSRYRRRPRPRPLGAAPPSRLEKKDAEDASATRPGHSQRDETHAAASSEALCHSPLRSSFSEPSRSDFQTAQRAGHLRWASPVAGSLT